MRSASFISRMGFAIMIVGGSLAGCSDGADGLQPQDNPTQPLLSASARVMTGGIGANEIELARLDLHRMVSGEQVQLAAAAPMVIKPTRQELRAIAEQDRAERTVFPGPKLMGATFPVMAVVDLSNRRAEARSANALALPVGAIQGTQDGGFVWTSVVRSEGAKAVRLHLTELDLPAGVELFVYGDLGEAYGPYTGTGPQESGEYWTPSMEGDTAFVQLRHRGLEPLDLTGARFVIAEIAHIDPMAMEVAERDHDVPEYGPYQMCYNTRAANLCIHNVSCYNLSPAVDSARNGIAHIQFLQKRSVYMCTGGLLVTGNGMPQQNYFLTANHCVGTQAVANTVQFYFQYQNGCDEKCGTPDYDGVKVPVTGATLLKAGADGDFSLMKMNGTPPAGSVFLGWNATDLSHSDRTMMYRVSHPAGGPQAYSEHTVLANPPTVCSGLPFGTFIYSHDSLNGTLGGSSGSPVLNAAGEVVGQEYGACGNVADDCAVDNFSTVDGAFAHNFPFLSQWLVCSASEVCGDGVDNNCNGQTDEGCPTCKPKGSSCSVNSDCCSASCKGKVCR